MPRTSNSLVFCIALDVPRFAPTSATSCCASFMRLAMCLGSRASKFEANTFCTLPVSVQPTNHPKAQLWPHAFGQVVDCVVRIGGAASRQLEAAQHLREHIAPDFDRRLPGPLGKQPAISDKSLVASGLQVDRRESGKIGVEGTSMGMTSVTVANQIRRPPLHRRFRGHGSLLVVVHEAGPGGRQIEPA